jgi:hypothetical protein
MTMVIICKTQELATIIHLVIGIYLLQWQEGEGWSGKHIIAVSGMVIYKAWRGKYVIMISDLSCEY